MNHVVFCLIFFTLSFFLSLKARAQQNYSGNSVLNCKNDDKTGPSPSFLYTCNGLNKSCMAFLIFKSHPPYNTVTTISNLTSSNQEEIARINGANLLTVFPSGKEVIVPLNCSCATRVYYQAETNYVLGPFPTYFTVANDTFQGLASCDSLKRANPYGELDLHPGLELQVPLRCACPTWHQTRNGTKYLLTYSVNWGDNISNIATRFNVAAGNLVDANGFPSQTQVLYPFTTVLIPLPSEPVSSTTTIVSDPPNMSPLPVCSSKGCKSKRKLYTAVATTTGGFMLVLCVLFYAVFLIRKRSARLFKLGTEGEKRKRLFSEDIRGEIAIIEPHSKVYRFEEIKEATQIFSSMNRIKGSVFRGVFGIEREILAVKRMKGDASKEVNLLKKLNHFNLIKLQGYSENDGCFYLVYEYMENGSLREWLGKKGSKENQSLAKRIQIALDIANGLQYLHNFTEPCYVHKDINSGNILLNKDLRAKIANFALAEESERKITSGNATSHIVTKGYIAPEYLEEGIVTTKMDVYAFGVVLLELITSKDSMILPDGREVMLHAMVVNLVGKENEAEEVSLFVDPSLTGNSEKVCALQIVKLSLACLSQEPAERPNMVEIVSVLLKIYTNYLDQIIPTSINNSLGLER
ncbi:hypothetical protein RJT34_07998 [Clitoria ternatea]|uniref:LysM domain receptor-like kinase 4 n=1 Tax=Clitoria ternatea TaxID=43366 RepID=A0AAN9K3W9_CLITE